LISNYNGIIQRTKNDSILYAKVNLVKKAFYELSDSIMNDEYFMKL
jgi:hypothetical protein